MVNKKCIALLATIIIIANFNNTFGMKLFKKLFQKKRRLPDRPSPDILVMPHSHSLVPVMSKTISCDAQKDKTSPDISPMKQPVTIINFEKKRSLDEEYVVSKLQECEDLLSAHKKRHPSDTILERDCCIYFLRKRYTVKTSDRLEKVIKKIKLHLQNFEHFRRSIFAYGYKNKIKVFSMQMGKHIYTLDEHQDKICKIKFNPYDPNIMASFALLDRVCKIWDMKSGKCLHTIDNSLGPIEDIEFYPKNPNLITSYLRGARAKIWNIKTKQCLYDSQDQPIEGPIEKIHIKIDQENPRIIFSRSSQIIIGDMRTREIVQTLTGHTDRVSKIMVHPLENKIISCSYDQTTKIWDIETGECLHTLDTETNIVRYHPENPNAIISVTKNKIKIWGIKTGQCIHSLLMGPVKKIEFHPDNPKIIICYPRACKNVIFFNAETGQYLQDLATTSETVTMARYNISQPDIFFSYIKSSGVLNVWNRKNKNYSRNPYYIIGNQVKKIEFYPNDPNIIFFCARNESIINENEIRVFQLIEGRCIYTLCSNTTFEFMKKRDINYHDENHEILEEKLQFITDFAIRAQTGTQLIDSRLFLPTAFLNM